MGVYKLSAPGTFKNSRTLYKSFLSGNPTTPITPPDAGSYFPLGEFTLASDQATVTFNNIPQTYKHLQIRATTKNSGADAWMYLNLNGDSTSSYSFHTLNGNGASVSVQGGASQTYGRLAVDVAGQFGGKIIDILDYANSNKNTTVRCLWGSDINGAGGLVGINSFVWLNTNAVTSMTFDLENVVNFSTGSNFALYGVLA